MSAVAAAGAVFIVVRSDQDQRILGDVASAHLRSLQADHLTDVPSSDQHTVKPWFNGRLDVAPPVADLTAQGFTLLGGRLDYIDGRAVAAIVYRRRVHVINVFVAQAAGSERAAARSETVQGFNVRRWTERGLRFHCNQRHQCGGIAGVRREIRSAHRAPECDRHCWRLRVDPGSPLIPAPDRRRE